MTYRKDQLTRHVPEDSEDAQFTNQSSVNNICDGQGQGVSQDVDDINKAWAERKRNGGVARIGSIDEHLWLASDDEQDAE